ncbi:universal stress protein [Mycobacterium noviomagense]|uniref:universal stress protein n=1 Tax=Mycobacterium noviomagense TaxID=459858 RepID=UPI0013D5ECF3|nr:universal stress protein [Mycobacterium noviomagense]
MIADYAPKSVVVGIDGSPAAVAAAQWGADEALRHHAALELLYVVDRNRAFTPSVVKAQFSVAQAALQDAHAAVKATHESVRIQLETVEGDPGTTLTEASRSAALLCVGSPKAAPHGPSDSLAANMATSAHCSVAVVPATEFAVRPRRGWLVVLLHNSTDEYEVLQQAMEEALLRELGLRVVMTDRDSSTDMRFNPTSIQSRCALAVLDEHLVNWTRRYPGIDTCFVHTERSVHYVEQHEGSIESVVLGAENRDEVAQLVELTRSKTLHDANFSVLVVRGQHF